MTTRTWRQGLEWLPGVASLALLVGMLWLTRRGLDVVDESYLLRLVADPQASRPAGDVYLFGFVVHPLWELVGHDVALLRAAGIVVVGIVSAWLAAEGVAVLRDRGVAVPPRRAVTACLVAAASSLTVLSFNVMVPAYRSVALLGLVVAAAGAARALRGQPAAAGLLLGLGGWTCFAGKPTSAAVLAVVVAGFLWWARLLSLRLAATATAGVLLPAAVTLAVARMTPVDVVTYLNGGARTVEILGDHPNLRVVLGLTDVQLQGLAVFGPALLLPALVATAFRDRRTERLRVAVDAAGLAALLACAAGAALVASAVTGPLRTGWQVLSLGWLVVLLVVVELVRSRRTGDRLPDGVLPWVVLLLVLPYAGAVGSNLSFSTVVPLMMVPWVVAAAVVLLCRTAGEVAPAHSVATMLLVAVVAVMVWVVHTNSPEGGELARDLRWAPVAGGSLMLPPEDARAAAALHALATSDRISPSTPVVDLTGVGAGYAFMTGGRPLGRAHMYAYQPTSVAAAAYGMGQESCADRARSWALVREGGDTPLAPAFFVHGVSRVDDYDVVLRFTVSRLGTPLELQLLSPRASVAAKLGCPA